MPKHSYCCTDIFAFTLFSSSLTSLSLSFFSSDLNWIARIVVEIQQNHHWSGWNFINTWLPAILTARAVTSSITSCWRRAKRCRLHGDWQMLPTIPQPWSGCRPSKSGISPRKADVARSAVHGASAIWLTAKYLNLQPLHGWYYWVASSFPT